MKGTEARKINPNKYGWKLGVICFWLLCWQLLSMKINQEIFLASPYEVLKTLMELCLGIDFWRTILFSTVRIISGFLLALTVGVLLAVGAYHSKIMKELISPLIKVIKTMPVASFIILALLWIRERNLSVLISFLMVLPMIYSNVLQGLGSADEKLLQMAKVFRISKIKRMHAIYLPAVMPYFVSAVSVGIGFSWKAGIAAEVIGTPANSIGKSLYEAKLYLMTKELFAWSVVIILISVIFEKVVLLLLRLLHKENREVGKEDGHGHPSN